MRVGAHPHTALQTFTWMIEGEVLHRDSLGSEQTLRPGQINLMTAGHGIVHTEDSLPHVHRLHAAQLWIALPRDQADCAPAFDHYPEPPCWFEDDCKLTLLAGAYRSQRAPLRLYSPLVGMDLYSQAGSVVDLELNEKFEYGILPLQGSLTIQDMRLAIDEFAFLGAGIDRIRIRLAAGSRALVLGGEPLAEPIVMWWNFVGHSRSAIAAAQREWETGSTRFGRVKNDDGRRLVAPPLPWSGA